MKLFTLAVLFFIVSDSLTAQCYHHHCQHMKNQALRSGSMMEDPGNARSDTMDVLNYSINFDMTQMNSQLISASCAVALKSRMNNIDWVNFDLLALTVDSVVSNDEVLAFVHEGEQLLIQLPMVLNTDDELNLTVHYHGSPEADPQWGGFYFSSGYAFNLGVAFESNPHNFGRVWFPCFDNFVERSTYDFHVLTNNNRIAYCGGIRTSVDTVGIDSLLSHWQIMQEIPSYLASVAATNYVHASDSFESISGDEIPIWLTARAVDTTDMKNSMINLVEWLEGAEQHYGPYRWSRVGYCAVPFNGGAMEHAMNIAYPLFAVDGTLGYETLYAHELAHHWWGDMVTCRNAYDMWINEGWAAYSEALFQEVIYGDQAYIDYVRANHKDVLLNAHENDGDRYPVSGIPHELTYGDHVYRKGADVAHTLRGYMEEDDFFTAIQAFMEEYQFSDVSSEDLRDFFDGYSEEDINSFFDNWVFAKGFPEFRISSAADNGGTWDIGIRQALHYAPQMYTGVPMQLTAMDADGGLIHADVVASGELSSVEMNLPEDFTPVSFFLNADDEISMAVLAESRWIDDTGNEDFDYAEMDLDVESLGLNDSIFMRVENHWADAAPEQNQPEFLISPDRWWNVISTADETAEVNATIRYYGEEGSNNYYDSLFFDYIIQNNLNEDSILLVYRPDGASLWQEWGSYELNVAPGGNDNWSGRIEILGLQAGQYAWAVGTGEVSVAESGLYPFSLYAAKGQIHFSYVHHEGKISIHNAAGQLIFDDRFSNQLSISTSGWSQGIYNVTITGENHEMMNKRLLIRP